MTTSSSKTPMAKATIWYTVCSIIQKGIAMLLIPLYVRLMTTEEYGMYTLFQSWASIIMIFSTLNLAAYSFNNCLIKHEDKQDWVNGVFLGLVFTLSLITSAIFLLFLNYWELFFGFSAKYIIAAVADSFCLVAIDLWCAKNRFNYRYKAVVFVTLLSALLNLVFGSVVVYFAQEKAFAAIAVKIAVQMVITVCLAISVGIKGRSFFDWNIWKGALLFNIPLIPHFLSTKILQQSDRIMIEKICGISDAAIYGFSYKISEAMLIFNSALLATLIPWTYRKLKDKKYGEIFDKAYGTILIVGLLNIVLVLLAPEAVFILGTEEYMQAVYIIPPIACSTYCMYLFNVFVNVTYFYGKNKYVVVASIVAAAINVVLNYIFIPQYGYIAAGYTTLVSYLILSIMHYIMQKQTLKSQAIFYPVYDAKKILITTLAILLVALLLMLLYPFAVVRYILFIGLIAIMLLKKNEIKKFVF